MTTLIIGTNRKDAYSAKLANYYSKQLEAMNMPHKILSLEDKNILTRNDEMMTLEKDYLLDAESFILFLPEYNGSIPGIFKLLLDNSDIKKSWWYKKVLLVGLADGRGGNSRGLDHSANIMLYLRMQVHYFKVMISGISKVFNENDDISNENIAVEIKNQLNSFYQTAS